MKRPVALILVSVAVSAAGSGCGGGDSSRGGSSPADERKRAALEGCIADQESRGAGRDQAADTCRDFRATGLLP